GCPSSTRTRRSLLRPVVPGLATARNRARARPPSSAASPGTVLVHPVSSVNSITLLSEDVLRVLSNRDPAGPVLRAPKTAELIASYIRGQIVRGDLKTGDALPSETVLMEMFGVSRPTLREAFRILEAESLISVRRGARGGARVVSPDIAVAARYVGLLLPTSGTAIAGVFEAPHVTAAAAAGHLPAS